MVMPKAISDDPRYADRLLEISNTDDIPEEWQDTPIEKLIASENFHQSVKHRGTPELLIVTCIEFRYALPIPAMFAYVIRRASGRLIGSEFSLAYVLAKNVEHIALIGHNDCGMTAVKESTPLMVEALVKQGWNRDRSEEFVSYHAARYSISDEIDALEKEYRRLKRIFPRLTIAPMFVCLADTKLYLPKWYRDQKSVPDTDNEVADQDLLPLV